MKAKNTKTPPKANKARRPRPSKLPYTVRGDTTPLTEAEERAQEEHVKKLVKLGVVKLGKDGPLPVELMRPGPRCKGDLQKALRWARDDS